MAKDHPSFTKPVTDLGLLWRYMGFSKFLSLLTEKALWFSAPSKFDDPFECSFSSVSFKLKRSKLKGHKFETLPEAEILKEIEANAAALREKVFVNC